MFSDPKHNVEQFMPGEGSSVADFGAGSGHYSIAAAEAVGENGKVYAIEIQKDLLSRVQTLARERHISNIEAIWADLEEEKGGSLKDSSVDCGIVANILFQIEDKENFAREVARVVRGGGKILIVDWADSFSHLGPPPGHVVNEGQVRELFETKGFIFEKKIYAGEHHFGLVMRKEKRI